MGIVHSCPDCVALKGVIEASHCTFIRPPLSPPILVRPREGELGCAAQSHCLAQEAFTTTPHAKKVVDSEVAGLFRSKN